MSGSHNTHAKLSPSAAKRWTACTAQPGYCEENADRIPKEQDSAASKLGTKAHDLAEQVLLEEITMDEVPDNLKCIQMYVDHCNEIANQEDIVAVEVEIVVPLYYSPEETGTCDFAAVSPKKLYLRDYKNGFMLVDAEYNKQLAIYGQSFIEENDFIYDFTDDFEVSLGIVQPNTHVGDHIKVWETTVGELREFCEIHIDPAIETINSGDPVFKPCEDACFFCPAKGFCEARSARALSALPSLGDFEEKTTPDPEDVEFQVEGGEGFTEQQIARVLELEKEIGKWMADVRDYCQKRAEEGNPVEGTKLVQGRMGNSKWVNEEDAAKFLVGQKLTKDERHTSKLISPTQAEKLLKDKLKSTTVTRNKFEALKTRAEGKPVITIEGDKRPAIAATIDLLPELDD